MGGGQICLCIALFLDKREAHKHIPRKYQQNAGTVLGQSQDNPVTFFVYVFSCLLFFFGPVLVIFRVA